MNFTLCDCSFGAGFYHTSRDGSHEYNPFVSEEVACADCQLIGIFYGHINYRHACVEVAVVSKNISYGKRCAFAIAAK